MERGAGDRRRTANPTRRAATLNAAPARRFSSEPTRPRSGVSSRPDPGSRTRSPHSLSRRPRRTSCDIRRHLPGRDTARSGAPCRRFGAHVPGIGAMASKLLFSLARRIALRSHDTPPVVSILCWHRGGSPCSVVGLRCRFGSCRGGIVHDRGLPDRPYAAARTSPL